MRPRNVQTFVDQLSIPTLRALCTEVSSLLNQAQEAKGEKEIEELEADSLRQHLVSILTSEREVARLYAQLSTYESEALHYFMFHVGEDFLTYRQLDQGMPGIRPTIFKLGLTGLRRKGLIYTVRRQWGEVAYVLPSDLGQLMYTLYAKKEKRKIEPCLEAISKYEEEFPPIYVDLLLLLDEIRGEKNSSIPLTKKGSIHKRYIRAWLERLPRRQEKLEHLSLVFAHRDTYNQHIIILLDFLTRKKMIRWYPGQLTLDNQMVAEWMQLSKQEMRKQFLQYWGSNYLPSAPWLVRYQKDMFSRAEGQWLYQLSFVEEWENEYSLPSINQVKELITTELLEPLVGLGLLERGSTDYQEEVWRWKTDQENNGQVWVQPNLELYSPSFLPFATLWKLMKILSLQRWENLLVFKLSKSKVVATLDRGESLQEWIAWLETNLNCVLPPDFKEQLNLWQKNQEQVIISTKTVIEIKDEQLAKVWLQWPEMKNIFVQPVSSTLFLVDIHKQDELLHLFAQKGFPVSQQEQENEATLLEEEVSLITFAQERNGDFKVESIFPELTEAIPVWNSLPDIWKKQFSTYHDQTKRKIVEQAIQYELKLKVETGLGDTLEIVPTRFQVENGRWICYDQQNRRHELDQLYKMQLLFPV